MTAAELDQLDAQQALLTDSLGRMLQGQWLGFPSLEANLLALDPGLTLSPRPPLVESEAGPAPPQGWQAVYDPNTSMPPQAASWTCSACSLAWIERATQVNPGANEWSAVDEIGSPQNINSTYGLMDGSGAQLQRVLRDSYGLPSSQAWLTFDSAYATYGQTAGMMSGGAIYHWVAVRGRTGDGQLWIANSAEGYCGVYSTLSRAQFNQWGPWSCVWLDNG